MNATSPGLNPYLERGMIRDPERFFGRTRELNQIFDRLATMTSISVVGERRIGKSSLLYRVYQSARERLGEDYDCHYLDLERVFSAEEFYDRACGLLGATGSTDGDFEQAIHGKKVVLCLDEFEQTTGDPDFGPEFFQVLRSLAQTGELALVVATQHKLSDLYRSGETLTSPFPNIFAVIYLGPLTEAEARELVMRPLKLTGYPFTEDEGKFVFDLVHKHSDRTHPYWLNVACSLFYEAKLSEHVDSTEVRRRFEEEVRNIQATRVVQPMQMVGEGAGAIRVAALLAAVGAVVGWFSIHVSSIIGVFLAGGVLLIALWLLASDWVQGSRWRGGTQ